MCVTCLIVLLVKASVCEMVQLGTCQDEFLFFLVNVSTFHQVSSDAESLACSPTGLKGKVCFYPSEFSVDSLNTVVLILVGAVYVLYTAPTNRYSLCSHWTFPLVF